GAGLPRLGSDIARNVLISGYMGVDFFFVLSGFLLFLPVAARGRFPDVRSYALRRAARILPAYYIALGATLALLLFLTRGHANPALTRHDLALNVVLHTTFLQHSLGNALVLAEGLGVNGALWTLSIEVFFYMGLPLIAVRYCRRPFVGLGIALVIAALWRVGSAHLLIPTPPLAGLRAPALARLILVTQIPTYFAHFGFGMTAAWLFVRMRRSRVAGRPWLVAVQVAALGGMIVGMELAGHRDMTGTAGALDHWSSTTPIAFGFAVLLLATALAPRWAQSPFANPVSRWLGDISYGAYLWHLLFIEFALVALHWTPAQTTGSFVRMFGFTLAGSLLAGWASFVLIERPSIAWARRRSNLREDRVLPVQDAAAP
ncbi:MAG TPA: acyltransferase, partial [Actinomycetota bacterium]|nr:acyltransferase [Actinomycetota bacterium]